MFLKPHRIPISALKFHPDSVISDPGLEELRASIEEHGQKTPIVVDALSDQVLDGSRRIRVLLELEQTHVSGITVSTLEEASEQIRLATFNPDFPGLVPTPDRLYRLIHDARNLAKARLAALKKRRVGVPRDTHLLPEKGSRTVIAEALGMNEGLYTAIVSVYRLIETLKDPVLQEEMLEQAYLMNTGLITAYTARGHYDRLLAARMGGGIITAKDQREAFTTLRAQMGGVLKGMKQFGEINEQVSAEELADVILSFEDASRNMRRFINLLKKRAADR